MADAAAYPHLARADEYIDAVLTGAKPANRYERLAVQRQRDDLARAGTPEFPYRFDEALAERACRFKSLMPHVKGRWARKRQRFELQGWQCFNTAVVFGWVHVSSGARRFQESYTEVPRKNGKSFDAAATGLYMFAADNEHGAEVYSGATTEKQAWEVFKPAREMALALPKLCYRFGIEVKAASMVRSEDGSKFEPMIGKPGDGASPHCAILDEFHEHKTPDQYDTMALGMGAREQPLMYIITTAGTSLSGPCYQRHLYAQNVLDRKVVDETFFAIIYTIDEGDDWTTVEAARKANPNFGVSILPERIERDLKAALQSAYLQNAYKTKRLNVWCGAKAAWMNMQAWAACPVLPKIKTQSKRRVFGGIDVGTTNDLSAFVLLFPPDKMPGLWAVYCRFYLPEKSAEGAAAAADYAAWAKHGHLTLTPGNVADYAAIETDVLGAQKAYKVEQIGFDPWQATHLASTLLTHAVPMVKVPQNTQHLSEPMKLLERLVLAKLLAHGNNPVLTWNMGNVVAKEDARGNTYPNKQSADAKIDGVLALLNAASRAFAAMSNTSGLDAWLKAATKTA